jgi:hypothetical protein
MELGIIGGFKTLYRLLRAVLIEVPRPSKSSRGS